MRKSSNIQLYALMAGASTIALTVLPLNANAEELKIGEMSVSVHGAATLGTGIRAADRDIQFSSIANARSIGVVSLGSTRNSDDGNLNFKKGDVYSTVLKAWGSVEFRYDNFGVFVRAKAWKDFRMDAAVPYGNSLNGYAPDTPLSDAGFDSNARFAGFALQEAYAFGGFNIANRPVELRIGNQLIDWGIRTAYGGGLNAINPVDFAALHRPGNMSEENGKPFPALYAKVGLTERLTAQGFWEFGPARNTLDGCGTFFSSSDYAAPGCNYIVYGNPSTQNDRLFLLSGADMVRVPSQPINELAQGGVGLKYAINAAMEAGISYAHYNSRSSILTDLSRSFRPYPATPFIVGNPNGLNPVFDTPYPAGIDMVGATFTTRLPTKSTISAEFAYRPNQPVSYNAGDVVTANNSNTSPSLLRAYYLTFPPGAIVPGYDRLQTGAANLVFSQEMPNIFGSKKFALSADVAIRQVYDLPNVLLRRYGRGDAFQGGPVNGVCPNPSAGTIYTGCTTDGYVTNNAWGFRIGSQTVFADVFVPNFDVTTTLYYGRDVSGWSYDGILSQGRNTAGVILRGEWKKTYYAEISYLPNWGGAFNLSRDRSSVAAAIGAKF